MKPITLRRIIDSYLQEMFEERVVKVGARKIKYSAPKVVGDYITSESDKATRKQMVSNKSPLMYELKQIIRNYERGLTDHIIDGWSKIGSPHYDYELAKEITRFKSAQEAWLEEALTSGTNNYGISFRLRAAHNWVENFNEDRTEQIGAQIEVLEAKVLEVKDVNEEKDTDTA